MYCTDRLSEILSDDIYAETQICNLYGTKGVGKSHMVAELMKERRKSGCPCGCLDFEEYKGLAAHTTLNALYQICDYLTAKHGMALTQFEIADEVNRERWGRIPYCQRKKEVVSSAIDQASDLSELVVDNYNETRIDRSWMDTLISNTRHVTWVFVSRSPIQYTSCPVVHLPVAPMDHAQLKIYLQQKQFPWTEELVEILIRTSAGIPLRIERMLEYAARKGQLQETDWAQLESLGYKSIAQESLTSLSIGEKEILFQLNFAQSFDESLFSRMFPGRLFSLYRNWFHSSLFCETEPGRYKVQNALRDEIAAYMHQLDDHLEQVCRENLYLAEYNWFKDLDPSSQWALSQCDYHLRNLLAYGLELSSADGYARDLMGLRNILLELGYTTEYCHTLSLLVQRVSPSVRIDIFRDVAVIYLGISQFEESRRAIHGGMELLSPQDVENWITFSFILMELEYISPSDSQDAVQHCVDIAKNLVDVLQANMDRIPLKLYINSMAKAHLYLSKSYIVKNEYDKGASYARYVLDLCADPELCATLSLHASHAKAQEYMGGDSQHEGGAVRRSDLLPGRCSQLWAGGNGAALLGCFLPSECGNDSQADWGSLFGFCWGANPIGTAGCSGSGSSVQH